MGSLLPVCCMVAREGLHIEIIKSRLNSAKTSLCLVNIAEVSQKLKQKTQEETSGRERKQAASLPVTKSSRQKHVWIHWRHFPVIAVEFSLPVMEGYYVGWCAEDLEQLLGSPGWLALSTAHSGTSSFVGPVISGETPEELKKLGHSQMDVILYHPIPQKGSALSVHKMDLTLALIYGKKAYTALILPVSIQKIGIYFVGSVTKKT